MKETETSAPQDDIAALARGANRELGEQDAQRAAIASARKSRNSSVRAMAFVVVGCALGLLALYRWQPLSGPSPREIEDGRRALFLLVVQAVGEYSQRNGQYPENLGEALAVPVDAHYRRTVSGYELSIPLPDGRVLVDKR